MKIAYLKSLALIALSVFALSGCIKDEVVELTDQGTTMVKIMEAPERNLFYEPFNNVKSVDLFSVRKDANSAASLNTPQAVTLTMVPGYIDRYNDANDTNFEVLPDSLYTTTVQRSGNTYTMNMGSGEFAKDFNIQLNGAKWNLEHTYALAFAISDVAGANLSAGKDTIIVTMSVVNELDGAYEVTGEMVDAVAPTLTGLFPMNYHLITAGPTTVIGYDPDYWVDYFVPILSAGAVSGYGSFVPVFTFDPETHKITSVVNGYGQPAGNTRAGMLDPAGVNTYDPVTKTIDVSFFMTQSSVVPAAPHIRTSFHWVMTYKGAR